MPHTSEIRVKNLSKKRQKLLDEYESSWDKEKSDYMLKWNVKIDELAEEINDCIDRWRHDLPFEFILEELSNLGDAPCLLYDDDGHWAISGEGWQSISTEGKDDCNLCHFIEKTMWQDSIRLALDHYLDEIKK